MRSCLMGLAMVTAVGAAVPAYAGEYAEFPAPTPFYPFKRSALTGRAVVIPPYRRVFPVRVYTTPPQPPYYNVPPYAVVAPY